MFTANTHETDTRSWASSHPPEDVEARVRDSLGSQGAQVRTTGDVLEATFGSRWMMVLGGLTFARRKVPYTVRVECNAGDGDETAVTAHAADTVVGLFRLRALGPQYQQRFAEVFDELEQVT